MAFLTDQERYELLNSSMKDYLSVYTVQFRKNGRESELVCDDLDHALDVANEWTNNNSEYVEIFRVLFDGSLNPTIGNMVEKEI